MPTITQQSLLTKINEVTASVAKSDGQLEAAARAGSRIGDGWGVWFFNTSNSLMDIRDGLAQLQPNAAAELAALRTEALNLAYNGGSLNSGFRQGSTFSSSWGAVLDPVLAALSGATKALLTVPGPKLPVPTPSPKLPTPGPTLPPATKPPTKLAAAN